VKVLYCVHPHLLHPPFFFLFLFFFAPFTFVFHYLYSSWLFSDWVFTGCTHVFSCTLALSTLISIHCTHNLLLFAPHISVHSIFWTILLLLPSIIFFDNFFLTTTSHYTKIWVLSWWSITEFYLSLELRFCVDLGCSLCSWLIGWMWR